MHRLIPGADEGWTAAGVDEFLRAYLTPAGRAAFYAAARQIYLEEPHGAEGFWTRLRARSPTPCSSGVGATDSSRSRLSGTLRTHSRRLGTSSSTAGTYHRLSVRETHAAIGEFLWGAGQGRIAPLAKIR